MAVNVTVIIKEANYLIINEIIHKLIMEWNTIEIHGNKTLFFSSCTLNL